MHTCWVRESCTTASNRIWLEGGYFSRISGISKHIGLGKRDGAEYSVERILTYAPTCFLVIPDRVYRDVGYMDESYFVYYDDTDFCRRLSPISPSGTR